METEKDMERDAGGSWRKGIDSPTSHPPTPAHAPTICTSRSVSRRSGIPGSSISFTFNTGAPQGWVLREAARCNEAARSLGRTGKGSGAAGRGRGAADRCSLLPAAYLVQAVRAAGKCDAVFKGFSDCLLKLGDSMANYPQGLDDKTNIKTVCT